MKENELTPVKVVQQLKTIMSRIDAYGQCDQYDEDNEDNLFENVMDRDGAFMVTLAKLI